MFLNDALHCKSLLLFASLSFAPSLFAHKEHNHEPERYDSDYSYKEKHDNHSLQNEYTIKAQEKRLHQERINQEQQEMHRYYDKKMHELDKKGREIDEWEQKAHQQQEGNNHQHIAREANRKRDALNQERDAVNRERAQKSQALDRRKQYN